MILAVVPILALLGVLFTMAQCLQSVRGTTAMGSGLRLLRLVAGLVVGAVPTARVVAMVGAKVTVTAGFVVRGVGDVVGKPRHRYSWYTYEATDTAWDGGEVTTDSGNGINIYRRGDDGTWRVWRDAWATDRAAG